MTDQSIISWTADNSVVVPPGAQSPRELADYAVQLKPSDREQIIKAFEHRYFEMGLNFLWLRTVAALRRELATVGLGLLGEMVGNVDIGEDDDIEDILTPREVLRLSEELGVVSPTEAMRLRHTHEIVSHFSQLAMDETASETIDDAEALAALNACVKAVLSRRQVEVARKFVEFRESLETSSLLSDEGRLELLTSSPYFFWKLTIGILMNSAKESEGVKLEHCLANINVLLPRLWTNLREAEKWNVGRTYAEVYSDGRTAATNGLKRALLKVRGFDFVPENLRSDTFVKAANSVLRAHDGMNNFYNEASPIRNLSQLGSSIPVPALSSCVTALLSVYLGNEYGNSWSAAPIAEKMLFNLTNDRWQYYLNQVLPADTRILGKLSSCERPRSRWIDLAYNNELFDLQAKDQKISALLVATKDRSEKGISKAAAQLLNRHYGNGGT